MARGSLNSIPHLSPLRGHESTHPDTQEGPAVIVERTWVEIGPDEKSLLQRAPSATIGRC